MALRQNRLSNVRLAFKNSRLGHTPVTQTLSLGPIPLLENQTPLSLFILLRLSGTKGLLL